MPLHIPDKCARHWQQVLRELAAEKYHGETTVLDILIKECPPGQPCQLCSNVLKSLTHLMCLWGCCTVDG